MLKRFGRSWVGMMAILWLGAVAPWVIGGPVPAPDSGNVALLVGKLLSREHFRKQPLDDAISQQFLRNYLDVLDYNHLLFLESDITEFKTRYGSVLDDEILRGNVQAGFDIFDRYVHQVEKTVAMVQEILKEDFSFTKDESIVMDRKDAPWPKTEEESRQLWRQRIKYELLQEKLNKKKISEARETVSRRYSRLLKSVHEEDSESVLQLYLTSLTHAYDPHSDYMAPTELNNFAISMRLSLVGIGALLSSEDGYAKVIAIVPGGPADIDKRLKVNDRIAAVSQGDGLFVDVVDMKLNKAVEMIRGEKNTEVRLQIIPAEASDPSTRVEIRLKRDEIKLTEAEAKAKVIEHPDAHGKVHRLGYIELPSFYSDATFGQDSKSSTRDVARLIEKLKLQNVEGIILDLRRNGGGVLAETSALTGLFIEEGPVVQIKDSRGRIRVLNDDDPSVLYKGPLVLLTSHLSASASEILAAALQDYGRAVIVGEQSTFGKGTVQKVEELGRYLSSKSENPMSGGALKITTQKFYRISGGSTQYRGVIPDIRLPSELDYLKINESSLKNALPYDEVLAAKYNVDSKVKSLYPELRKRSQDRISHNPEFDYIREDIVRLKSRLEAKGISLNEAKRLQEKKEDSQRMERRKLARASLKGSPNKALEITLDSLGSTSSNAPALTRQVLEEARAHFRDSEEDLISKDPLVDPELDEGCNVLSDLIELLPQS